MELEGARWSRRGLGGAGGARWNQWARWNQERLSESEVTRWGKMSLCSAFTQYGVVQAWVRSSMAKDRCVSSTFAFRYHTAIPPSDACKECSFALNCNHLIHEESFPAYSLIELKSGCMYSLHIQALIFSHQSTYLLYTR
ncbi:hypothetical protein EMCRGX_G022502, partial [Ephydatia muelleri]